MTTSKETSQEIIIIDEDQAARIFTEGEGLHNILLKVTNIVTSFEHDLSTASGRKKTASLAHKVARLKVHLDNIGKEIVADWKKKSKKVDETRKIVRETLDNLKTIAREPLTEWEEAERKRKDSHLEKIKHISDYATQLHDPESGQRYSSKDLENKLLKLSQIVIDSTFEEYKDLAITAKKEALTALEQSIENAKAIEAEEARKVEEEARRKAEEKEKIRKEAEEKARKEAEEKAAKAIKEAEEKARKEIEKANQEKKDAEERTRKEAAEKSKKAIKEAEEKARKQVEAANKGKEEAEEKLQQAMSFTVNKGISSKSDDSNLSKDISSTGNESHQDTIRAEVEKALRQYLSKEDSKRVVKAIDEGSIPHVQITYQTI